jgi:hypothetical protein
VGKLMSTSVVAYILVAIGICTIHLFIGYLLGQHTAGKAQAAAVDKVVVAVPQIEQLTTQLQERLAEVISLASEARALSEDCSSPDLKLPAYIVYQANSLARGSSLLRKNMEFMTHVHSQRGETSEASARGLAPAQVQQEPDHGSDSTRPARFRYEAWQHVAPMQNGELPSASEFEAVQCRDLSRAGFSFFTEDLPNADMLVVAMGTPPDLRFFTAKVAGSPTASRHGKVGYQIECEFVSKLAETYQWDEVDERIIAASSMGEELTRDAGHAHAHAL